MIVFVSKHGAVREFTHRVAVSADAAAAAGAEATTVDDSPGAGVSAGTPVSRGSVLDRFDVAHRRDADAAVEERSGERLLIAAPIYAGSIPRSMGKWIDARREQLLDRPVALALACLYQGEEARIQLNQVFPPWLTGHASQTFLIGGRVRMGELSAPVRFLVKRILGQEGDVDTMDWSRADAAWDWLTGRDTLGHNPGR